MDPHGQQHQHQHQLRDNEQLLLSHRVLLEEQKHLFQLREQITHARQPTVCPNFSVFGHAGCSYCQKHGLVQPVITTDMLLKALFRPVLEPIQNTPIQHYTTSADYLNFSTAQPTPPAPIIPELPVTSQGPSNIHNKDQYRQILPTAKARATEVLAAAPNKTDIQIETAPSEPYQDLPLPKNFVPVRIPDSFPRFLDLPIAIRQRIYLYLVDNGHHGLLMPKDLKTNFQPPITRVNHQIRGESLLLLFSNNPFNANNRELCKSGLMFARRVGNNMCTLIRSWKWYTAKRTIHVNFSHGGTPFQVTYHGVKGEERASEIVQYFSNRTHNRFGIDIQSLAAINEIILRANTKPPPTQS